MKRYGRNFNAFMISRSQYEMAIHCLVLTIGHSGKGKKHGYRKGLTVAREKRGEYVKHRGL